MTPQPAAILTPGPSRRRRRLPRQYLPRAIRHCERKNWLRSWGETGAKQANRGDMGMGGG
jgi:hypothetical protein